MRGKDAGWWSATVFAAVVALAAAFGRAAGADIEGGAESAGYVVGAVLFPVVIVGLVAFVIVRFTRLSGEWALPSVLLAAAVLNLLLLAASAAPEGG